jgi:uncharacterized protein YcsI (UPF0317 family)
MQHFCMKSSFTPAQIRELCRLGQFTAPTAGVAAGFVQTNLVVLPKSLAFDFLLFCQRNPKPCPVLDVTDPGSPEPRSIGCSFTFETAMLKADLPVRHIEESKNVPMYRTNIPCLPAGCFSGEMVVSMRPLLPPAAIQAVKITSRHSKTHGTPIHLGDPAAIGIVLCLRDWF